MNRNLGVLRAALNCTYPKSKTQDNTALCKHCGAPFYLHAEEHCTVNDLGFISKDHPAWLAIEEAWAG